MDALTRYQVTNRAIEGRREQISLVQRSITGCRSFRGEATTTITLPRWRNMIKHAKREGIQ